MTQELPKYFDVRRLVERNGTISGILSAARLVRISLPYMAGDVMVSAVVSTTDPDNPRLVGHLETELGAICQRCLQAMVVRIDRAIDSILVDGAMASDAQVDGVPDSLFVIGGKIDIEQFVEDEIMLACPMIPLHSTDACHASESAKEIRGENREKPFVGLSEMLAAVDDKQKP